MSFHHTDMARLRAAGGASLRKWERLLAEAHGAQHGSPAEMALRRFQAEWLADPVKITEQAEHEEALRVEPEAEPEEHHPHRRTRGHK